MHLLTVDSKYCPNAFKNSEFGEKIIHGIIGVATESGELLDLLYRTLIQCETLDEVNLKEEMGDLFWYLAVLSDASGVSFDEVQQVNIAKLRARYPNKFTEFDAANRNLSNERSILESK